jgi:uncharacterized protein
MSQKISDNQVLCHCHGVKADEVKEIVKLHQPTNGSEVIKHSKAGSACGCCKPSIEDIIEEHSTLEKKGVDWNIYLRQAHLWLSLVSFIIIFLFAFTGYLMNHEPLFGLDKVELTEKEFTVPEAIALDKVSSQLKLWLKEEQDIRGRVSYVERDEESLELRTEAPGYVCEVFIDTASRSGDISISQSSFLAALSDLHRGRGVGNVGSWLIDISAIAIMIVSLSGMALFFIVRSRWKLGITFVLANGVLLIIVLLSIF